MAIRDILCNSVKEKLARDEVVASMTVRLVRTVEIARIAHTAHLYQPGTRRPYGVLEWPAMLRLLDAEERHSGYPPYWQ